MTTLRFTVSVHEDDNGSLWAQVQEWARLHRIRS
jgi:hypothetical protein